MKYTLIFIFGLKLVINQVNAQSIGSLKILPENPPNSDEVKLVCHAYFPTGGARLDSSNLSISNFDISISSYYYRILVAIPSVSIDTITIGKLAPGDYELVYLLKDNLGERDTAKLSFKIGINTIEKRNEQKLKIFPNPGNGLVSLCLPDAERYSINIVNSLGQTVDVFELKGHVNYKIALKLNKGLYNLNAISASGLSYNSLINIE